MGFAVLFYLPHGDMLCGSFCFIKFIANLNEDYFYVVLFLSLRRGKMIRKMKLYARKGEILNKKINKKEIKLE